MSRFAGAWVGPWKNRDGSDGLCHALVVEEVFASGYARVIYSQGTDEGWKVRQPDFWRATGRVVDGVLSDREFIGAKGEMTVKSVKGAKDRVTVAADWVSKGFTGPSRFVFGLDGGRIREMRITSA